LILAPLEDALKKVKHKEIKNELGIALNNGKRLLNLTNEILDLSKIDADKLSVDTNAIELRAFLNRVFHAFDSLARVRQITMLDNINDLGAIFVETDSPKLEKILNNLISNAIKYSSNGGKMEFQVDTDLITQNKLSIIVKDEGIGIPIDEQANIFNRYYQSSNTPQSAGTGIGLSLVKELVHLLNGDISFSSVPNKGSVFKVILPIIINDIVERKPEIAVIQPPSEIKENTYTLSGSKPKILIVEDDLEMSKYLLTLLAEVYDCDVAYNGTAALEQVQKNKYDLISSDVMMPELDGFALRQQLQNHEDYKDIPFIMLTARALEEDKLRGLKLGVDDYITKPFSSEEYKARVYNLLKNKIQREEIKDNSETENVENSFIKTAEDYILQHLDDTQLSVTMLATHLSYSNRQLRRLLQKYTGLSPIEFILEIRLQKAFQMIKERRFSTINEVRYEVGIESASYFSNKFKERFGISPSSMEDS